MHEYLLSKQSIDCTLENCGYILIPYSSTNIECLFIEAMSEHHEFSMGYTPVIHKRHLSQENM